MKSVSSWLVASGALLLIVGFFLPVISISHQGQGLNVSFFTIAGYSYWFLLYFAPVCALAALILSFIPSADRTKEILFLIAQIAGLGLCIMPLFGTLMYFLLMPQKLLDLLASLLVKFNSVNFDITPLFSLFILFFGIVLAILGVLVYFFPVKQQSKQTDDHVDVQEEGKSAIKKASLEVVKGKLTGKKFDLNNDNFSIGRGRDSDLQLSDAAISRLHVRIRYAQATWYLQDQNSKTGTFLNGELVNATRLNSGDHIKVGEDVFVFRILSD